MGIVPTLDVDSLEVATLEILANKFEEAKAFLVNKDVDEKLINENAIITPSCGAGGLTTEQAEKAMKFTSQLAGILRDKNG